MARDAPRGGRGGGRGGRSSGRGREGRGSTRNKRTKPNEEYVFAPRVEGQPQLHTYASIKEHIANKIQRTFTNGIDTAKSLRMEAVVDLSPEKPVVQTSTATDEPTRKHEQDLYDEDWKSRNNLYNTRCEMLKVNLTKAFSLIHDIHCTKAMRQRLHDQADFETRIRDDPIALLTTIRNLAHDPVRARNPIGSMLTAMRRFLNFRQRDEEDLSDYVQRFKDECNTFISYVGRQIWDWYAEQLPEYATLPDDIAKQTLKTDTFKAICGYLLIDCCDRSKYKSLVDSLSSHFSRGNDQYPTTVEAASDMLNAHKPTRKDRHSRQRGGGRGNGRGGTRGGRDGSSGGRSTSDDTQRETSFAQRPGIICHCCGQPGHKSPDCPRKESIARDQWWVVRQEQQHLQQLRTNDDVPDEIGDDSSVGSTRSVRSSRSSSNAQARRSETLAWSALQVNLEINATQHSFKQLCKSLNLMDVFILDNASTLPGTLGNPDFMVNIRTCKKPVRLYTNTGDKRLTLKGDIPGLFTGHYDPGNIGNILGLFHMAKKYRITFDSAQENAFIVHLPDKILKFEAIPEGLYVYKPSPAFIENNRRQKTLASASTSKKAICHTIATVEGNKEGHTKREADRANTG